MLLQIVPHLPPAIEGVGSYAAALGQALAGYGMSSRFLVGDRDGPGTGQLRRGEGLAAAVGLAGSANLERAVIGERSAPALAAQLAASSAGIVLVHYVNYGYERRGCPSWLVGGLVRWRAAAPGRRLMTCFHEVYAGGPPWRSSFWVAPVQRRLAARLLRASDGAATSLALYGRMLARWRPCRQVMVMPVFSTVGEPKVVPPLAERRPRAMLVFGGAGNRRRAYGELRESLIAACRGLSIAKIVDVGPRLAAEQPARLDGLPVRTLGALPEAEVSAVLLRSYAGFLGYPAALLAKSTVYAAYCAHGLVPVCAWPRRRRGQAAAPAPCWEPGREPALADPADLAARARAWYGDHDLAHQAVRFHALLAGLVGEDKTVAFNPDRRLRAARLPATGRTPPSA